MACMTLAQLAEKSGTTAGYLSEIENGKKNAGGELLIAIAKELDLKIDAIANIISTPSVNPETEHLVNMLQNNDMIRLVAHRMESLDLEGQLAALKAVEGACEAIRKGGD